MNSRKLIALFLVFALTGSALAAQQQRLYRGSADGDAEAEGVVGVQQHSVFVEIVIDKQDDEEQVHKFAAVVGLIKKCKQVRNVFDNAVLWFNDQFLFGEKRNDVVENETDVGLGYQPNETVTVDSGEGFIGQNEAGTPRWGGCYTPDGFAHAIGADDPFGFVSADVQGNEANASLDDAVTDPTGTGVLPDADDNMDVVKELIDLDQTCQGCIFEYHSSFFVVDPNGQDWIVDKYVYPLSVMGNLFTSGSGDDCGTPSNTTLPFSTADPRANQHHADTCKDPQDGDDDDRENHCYNDTSSDATCDGSDSDSDEAAPTSELVEPLFSVHLQVNPETPTNLGFADTARTMYNMSTDPTTEQAERDGQMYPSPGSEMRENCENADADAWRCSIEYNFLLAVDFNAFDDVPLVDNVGADNVTLNQGGENEIQDCGKEHGEGGADSSDSPLDGNSHPVNPEEPDEGPAHCHSTVNLDIFYHDLAPNFTMEYQYWSDDAGTPIKWTEDCTEAEDTIGTDDERHPDAISARTPMVCDYDDDAGEFHAHDGSQTIRPTD